MAFREYKIGTRLFGVALGGSMMITLYFPTIDMTSVQATETAMRKALSAGRQNGFAYEDPFVVGDGKPVTVVLRKDPVTGEKMEPMEAYVFPPGTPFPSAIRHPRTLGSGVKELSLQKGRIGEADESRGAVFYVDHATYQGEKLAYIVNATALKGWQPEQVLAAVPDQDKKYIGTGKTLFVREQCWWCHTLLPEETQDWQYFGVPPRLGDFNSEGPTAFGSDRKAPDLLHVASRNSSREWMLMHFFNPRLVQPHSIMPRFDYLWDEVDANGNKIDYAAWRKAYEEYEEGKRVYPPEVPEPAPNSRIRKLVDFVLSLK